MRRNAVAEMRERKIAMIGGIYANPNFDGGEVSRTETIEQIEKTFQEIIMNLYDPEGKTTDERLQEDMETNPFFTAMNLPQMPTDSGIDYSAAPTDEELERLRETDQG